MASDGAVGQLGPLRVGQHGQYAFALVLRRQVQTVWHVGIEGVQDGIALGSLVDLGNAVGLFVGPVCM